MGAWEIGPFDTDKDGFVTWTELFDHVRHETQVAFREFKQDLLDQDQTGLDRGMLDSLRRQLDQVPQALRWVIPSANCQSGNTTCRTSVSTLVI